MCLVWLRSSSPDGFHEQDLTPDLHSAGTLLHPLHPLPPTGHSYTRHLIVPHCQILHSPNHLCRNSYFVPLQTQRRASRTVCLCTVGFTNVRHNAEHPSAKMFNVPWSILPSSGAFTVDTDRCARLKIRGPLQMAYTEKNLVQQKNVCLREQLTKVFQNSFSDNS